jgi:hypothetical protein
MISAGAEAIEAQSMTSDPTDWHQVLARVSGQLVRGEQRVATHELLTVHLGVPVTDRTSRRLRRVMRDLGWHGPRLMRWGKRTLHGYWRYPTVGLPAVVPEEPVAEAATAERETLAPELERVTLLGLQKLEQILRIPTDRGDGNLLRAQTAAARPMRVARAVLSGEKRKSECAKDPAPEPPLASGGWGLNENPASFLSDQKGKSADRRTRIGDLRTRWVPLMPIGQR